MHGDEYYLFRHAIMRDAAYLLHTPTMRGTLHRVALELIEAHFDTELPEPKRNLNTGPLPVDAVVSELARHARFAQDEPYANIEQLRRCEAQFLIRAGNHAERSYDREEAITAWSRLVEVSDGIVCFYALHRLSGNCRAVGRLGEALRLSEQAWRLACAELDSLTKVVALGELALIHWYQDQPDTARRYLEQAAGLLDDGVGKGVEANTIGLLAMVLEQLGRLDEAEARYLRALELLKEAGDKHNEGVFLQNLAGLYIQRARNEEGERLLHRAIRLQRETGDDTNYGVALNNLTVLEIERGNYARAIAYANDALTVHAKVGNRRSLGLALSNRGMAYRKMGEFERAIADFNAGLAIHRELDNRSSESNALAEIVLVEIARDNFDTARALWKHSIALTRSIRSDRDCQEQVDEMRSECRRAGIDPFE
ncbi:MAG: tetratricopeptide repeat protein [Planctomycetes bacterium]|nr:tetratricopeptide repeat protein [Planctomycetota bacterium]